MDLLLLLLLSHLLGDFTFQSDKMARIKDQVKPEVKDAAKVEGNNRLNTLLIHDLIHGLLYGAALLFLAYVMNENYEKSLLIWFVLTFSHLAIDWGKPLLTKIGIKDKYLIFIVDQFIHIGIIFLIVNYIIDIPILELRNAMKTANFFEKSTISLIILILLTTFSNIFTRSFLDTIKQTENPHNGNNNNDEIKTGRYIGALERILAFLAVYTGSYTVLVGIFATKTAIRFKEFEKKDFAEYYFIGTSLSALIAILLALFYRWLL